MSARIKHGHWRGGNATPTYRSWRAMKERCLNENHEAWSRYGGKGISICSAWLVFEHFLNDMGERPKGMELDRIDNLKGYYPENCRWATRKTNSINRTSTRFITFAGETHSLGDWALERGMHRDTLKNRLNRGWSVGDALIKPVRKKKAMFDRIREKR